MRQIYPKLITSLFFVLFAAMILKFADADSKATDQKSSTAEIKKY